MENISLKNKILLILTLPLVAIMILSYQTLYDKIEQKNNIDKIEKYIDLSLASSSLLNILQEEREQSLIFINSYGKSAKKSLLDYRDNVDSLISEFTHQLNSFDSKKYSKNVEKNIRGLKKDIKKLNSIREKVDKLALSDSELLVYYSTLGDKLLFFISDVQVYNNDGKLSKELQGYLSLVYITEAASKERRVLRDIFEKGVLSNNDYSQYIDSLATQNTYLSLLEKVFSKEHYSKFTKGLQDCSSCNKVIEFRDILENKSKKNEMLSKIEQLAGFGGLIHTYKNFLLEKDEKYLKKIQRFHSSILRELNKYRRIKGTTKEEKRLIKKIKNTFDEYMGYTLDIQEGISQGKSIEEINTAINVDYADAIKALSALNFTIYGANYNDWFSSASNRIMYFRDYSNIISSEIKNYIREKDNELTNSFIMTTSFVIVILLIVFLVSTYIIRKISNALITFKRD